MLIERPPRIFRWLMRGATFRVPAAGNEKTVYLTFDDGPIPEVTPWVLDTLDRYGVKATFFMVGDNARRNPALVREVLARGHRVGNHTMHHLQGSRTASRRYLLDVERAAEHIPSDLFRPPHGWIRPGQLRQLRKKYRVVMFDLVTRDYSRHMTAADVVANVKRYARPGSVIVFHDSLKSAPRIRESLPTAIEWLRDEGYTFGLL